MFHSLKENVFQWGKIRKIEKLNTEVSVILKDLVNDKKQDVVIKKIVELAKKRMNFETCMLYEMLQGNKLKMLYSDIPYRSVLKHKEKLIFQNKRVLFKRNDLCPQDDEGAVYHPVVIRKRTRYVFVFDGMDMDSYEETRRDRNKFYQDLELIMGNLRNRTLANRAQYVDSLTGLPNERQLRKDMEYCIVSEKDYIFAIIELEGMKELNEKHGMGFGDMMIKKAKSVIEQRVRSGDGVYRFIGAKLAMLLSGTQEKHLNIMKDIHDTLCNTVITAKGGEDVSCTVTIGALEVRYLDEKNVDYAYERCRHALTVEKGGICFVGERREVQLYVEKDRDVQGHDEEQKAEPLSEELTESLKETVKAVMEETENVQPAVPEQEDVCEESTDAVALSENIEPTDDESGDTGEYQSAGAECEGDFTGYSDEDIAGAVSEGMTMEEYDAMEDGTQCTEKIEEEEESGTEEEWLMSEMKELVQEVDIRETADENVGENEDVSIGKEAEELCFDALSMSLPPEIFEEEVAAVAAGKQEQDESVCVSTNGKDKKETSLKTSTAKTQESQSKKISAKSDERKDTTQSTFLDIVQNADNNVEPVRIVNISEINDKKGGKKRKTKKKGISFESGIGVPG